MRRLFKILTIVCLMVDLVFAVLPSLVTFNVLIICFIITLICGNIWLLHDTAIDETGNDNHEPLDYDYYPDRDLFHNLYGLGLIMGNTAMLSTIIYLKTAFKLL